MLIEQEYNEILKANKPHILIDVRPQTAFKNGALPNAISIYQFLYFYNFIYNFYNYK